MEIGYGQSQIGLLNCISASSEIPVLLCIKKLTRKFGAIPLIGASTFLMGIRLFCVSGGSLPFFMLAQAMQGLGVALGAIVMGERCEKEEGAAKS